MKVEKHAESSNPPTPDRQHVVIIGAGLAMNWARNYVMFQRGTQLITGISGSRMEAMGRPAQGSQSPPQLMRSAG